MERQFEVITDRQNPSRDVISKDLKAVPMVVEPILASFSTKQTSVERSEINNKEASACRFILGQQKVKGSPLKFFKNFVFVSLSKQRLFKTTKPLSLANFVLTGPLRARNITSL